ncbi:MgtC/SapB family protein [Pseudomonas matsuisoli]|uniref:Protein MgtC n=1 Tax=Pseudomonas matsuisoli TaxID=1515666 RepID=A0A917Q0Y3_9PSED|nr:Mg(2+) transporter [Pseudomonas matsuisoli]
MSTLSQTISQTALDELSGFSDPEQITRTLMRLVIAALLGGLLGYQREQSGKAAGVRTHMLVAVGAALLVIAPEQLGHGGDALSRVIQGIVTGIGFLGAGTIIKGSSVGDVKGLTTAAGIWLTAAIGVAAGLGHAFSATACTLLTLSIFFFIPRLLKQGGTRNEE